jgi:dTDP-4-amino-4,6-dideoxygalactose transaminase
MTAQTHSCDAIRGLVPCGVACNEKETRVGIQMRVPLLDLKAQYAKIKDEIDAAVIDVLESQHFILGPKVQECEEAIAGYAQSRQGVGVSSGSDALLMCLMAERIGPGDEVITTPYTFFATVGAIARVGATPVFVDIDPATYNIDPAKIEEQVTEKTKAIIPVHLYGQCADMDPILEIARRRDLLVIEDAAQAIGAEYKGRRAGSMGDYGCFSFFPSKNLGCAGDGGMITTQDPERAERLRVLRAHGSKPKYYHHVIGGNFRLDAIQAAVVLVKLKYLDSWTAARQANADQYRRLFAELTRTLPIRLPEEVTGNRHIYNQFVIRAANRDELRAYLAKQGIATEIYYPVPMHQQECFCDFAYQGGSFPESEQAAGETLALPVFPDLNGQQQKYVVQHVAEFCGVD